MSANTSAYDMTIPSNMVTRMLCHPAFSLLVHLEAAGRPLRVESQAHDRKNALFCQRTVQKVEPVLSPEGLVAVDVSRRAEDLALDRFLRQRVVARADVSLSCALAKAYGVEALLGGERRQRGRVGDISLLNPDRTHDRARELETLG